MFIFFLKPPLILLRSIINNPSFQHFKKGVFRSYRDGLNNHFNDRSSSFSDS
jgi:hypothetical protein